jgi:hypothetical protein
MEVFLCIFPMLAQKSYLVKGGGGREKSEDSGRQSGISRQTIIPLDSRSRIKCGTSCAGMTLRSAISGQQTADDLESEVSRLGTGSCQSGSNGRMM